MDADRWHQARAVHAGLFWPNDRHLFRRRKPLAVWLARAGLVAGSAALLGLGLALAGVGVG